jgi:hypothetical protein
MINDDKAIDLAEWMDINTFLLGCPQRLIDIAEKLKDKIPLSKTEARYMERYRHKYQKTLF